MFKSSNKQKVILKIKALSNRVKETPKPQPKPSNITEHFKANHSIRLIVVK